MTTLQATRPQIRQMVDVYFTWAWTPGLFPDELTPKGNLRAADRDYVVSEVASQITALKWRCMCHDMYHTCTNGMWNNTPHHRCMKISNVKVHITHMETVRIQRSFSHARDELRVHGTASFSAQGFANTGEEGLEQVLDHMRFAGARSCGDAKIKIV